MGNAEELPLIDNRVRFWLNIMEGKEKLIFLFRKDDIAELPVIPKKTQNH